jgi:hypothetical protein
VAAVAVAMGLPPREVWEMHPLDFATVVAVMEKHHRR